MPQKQYFDFNSHQRFYKINSIKLKEKEEFLIKKFSHNIIDPEKISYYIFDIVDISVRKTQKNRPFQIKKEILDGVFKTISAKEISKPVKIRQPNEIYLDHIPSNFFMTSYFPCFFSATVCYNEQVSDYYMSNFIDSVIKNYIHVQLKK